MSAIVYAAAWWVTNKDKCAERWFMSSCSPLECRLATAFLAREHKCADDQTNGSADWMLYTNLNSHVFTKKIKHTRPPEDVFRTLQTSEAISNRIHFKV